MFDVDSLRDNDWLADLLADLWYHHFEDVPQINDVRIKFGQRAANRLGSIKLGRKNTKQTDGTLQKRSIITINGHFTDPVIPEDVIRAVIAHELVHYAHGFSSPHPKLHKHPHQGGVVDREIIKRGLGDVLDFHEIWIKKEWPLYLRANHIPKRRHRRFRLF